MITLKTLPKYLELSLIVHGDTFRIHKLSNGSLVITDEKLVYKANIDTINEAGIKWFSYILGTKVTGVIKFSEIIESLNI